MRRLWRRGCGGGGGVRGQIRVLVESLRGGVEAGGSGFREVVPLVSLMQLYLGWRWLMGGGRWS